MRRAAALLLSASSAAGDPVADSLRSLSFLNEGTVRATDSFERLTQCNGFTECYTTWDCGSIRDYLYDTTAGKPAVPPVGMRSAVPLGGLGAGTFEYASHPTPPRRSSPRLPAGGRVRADGSFADWQVENQGPALAKDKEQNSKLPTVGGALLGLRADGFATPLRTHPPPGLPAAQALSYSGAYPFARLGLNDTRLPSGLSAEVYAYSAVKLHDENASALPAAAFTLVLSNAGAEEVQVIATPSHLLGRISPIFSRCFPRFARFHRLDGTVPTSPKPEPRAKRQ